MCFAAVARSIEDGTEASVELVRVEILCTPVMRDICVDTSASSLAAANPTGLVRAVPGRCLIFMALAPAAATLPLLAVAVVVWCLAD